MQSECEELIGKGKCDTRFIWDSSNYDCECDKYVMLENIQVMKIVNVQKRQLINQLKNVVKILMEMK